MTITDARPSTIERRRIAWQTLHDELVLKSSSPWHDTAIAVRAYIQKQLLSELLSGDLSQQDYESELRDRTLQYLIDNVLSPEESAEWWKRCDNWAGALMRFRLVHSFHPYKVSVEDVEAVIA